MIIKSKTLGWWKKKKKFKMKKGNDKDRGVDKEIKKIEEMIIK